MNLYGKYVKIVIVSKKGRRHSIKYGRVVSEMGKYVRVIYDHGKKFECHRNMVLSESPEITIQNLV